MTPNTSDPDIEELQRLVDDLVDSTAALREYGLEHDIPAIERNAMRIEGTVEMIKQNVPGGLDRERR